MKVLHIVNGEHYAGAEKVQDLIFEEGRVYGIEMMCYLLMNGEFHKLCNINENQLVTSTHKSLNKQVFGFINFVKKYKPTIVHAHTPRSLLVAFIASKFQPYKIIYHQHSPASDCGNSKIKNNLNYLLEKSLSKRIDHIITVSNSLSSYVRSYIKEETPITMIHNGVPNQNITNVIYEISDFKYKVVMLALFRESKGLDDLLFALKLLKENYSIEISLDLIGGFETQNYENEIDELIHSLGLGKKIRKIGFIKNPEELLKNYDYLILPSRRGEGLPMVILEALSCSLPAIVTDVEGNSEIVKPNINGYICAPNDPLSISTALYNGYKDINKYNKLLISTKYNFSNSGNSQVMFQQINNVYSRVLNEN